MSNLINTLVLTSSLVVGDDSQNNLTETDLIVKQLDVNRSDYIKADFISVKNNESYIKRDYYYKKQQATTEKLKKKRIDENRKRRLERQRRINEQREKERLAKIHQQQIQKEKEIKLEKYKQELQKSVTNETTKNTTSSSNNTQSPQKQINNSTQKKTPTVQSSSKTYQITHYTSGCDGCTGITASGHNVRNTIYYNGMRIVAADPSIPLGTKLKVTYSGGYSFTAIVLDRGGAIKGNILDVLVGSKEEAYRLGRTSATVTILN